MSLATAARAARPIIYQTALCFAVPAKVEHVHGLQASDYINLGGPFERTAKAAFVTRNGQKLFGSGLELMTVMPEVVRSDVAGV